MWNKEIKAAMKILEAVQHEAFDEEDLRTAEFVNKLGYAIAAVQECLVKETPPEPEPVKQRVVSLLEPGDIILLAQNEFKITSISPPARTRRGKIRWLVSIAVQSVHGSEILTYSTTDQVFIK